MTMPTDALTRRPLRLAHASDIHLDTDYYGGDTNLASQQQCREIFSELLEKVSRQQPGLFLLPGDLFDSNRASGETIRWSMERLGELPFPVVIIPGNHDCMEEGAIFSRYDFSSMPNVDILLNPQGSTLELDELQVVVWGKAMPDHTPRFRPLEGMPPVREGWWNLAMGHGIYVGKDKMLFRSSPVEMRQIGESDYDYIALGHHHALLDVSSNGTAAYYSGAPLPVSSAARGTFLTVDLAEGQPPRVTIHHLEH